MRVVACLKFADRRPTADLLAAPDVVDERFTGMSPADEAALEWALAAGSAWGAEVVAVTFGPSVADVVLRTALASGVSRAVRIDGSLDTDSSLVAASLVTVLQAGDLVVCGDYSMDRGTGSVPAFLAAELGIPQALGLVGLTFGAAGALEVVRRLDGGRRERLAIARTDGRGAVLSVEGSTARLRRAGLGAVMRTRTATIQVVPSASVPNSMHPATVRPFRPRPRVLAPPAGDHPLDRLRALTEAGSTSGTSSGETVVLEPTAAAERILAALTTWGYLTTESREAAG